MKRFQRFARLPGQVFPWPLLPFGHRLAAHAASAAVVAGLLASRLLFHPAGPWEQDEALMACGVMEFDPGRHMPLPPGFPLWIALGKLVRACGAADPLVALQLASAVLSVLGLWALVGLWDRHAGRAVALAGALLAAFIPGVWFHATRGFSETPAAALTVLGLALWLRGGRAAFVPGVLAIVSAALMRPPLAPFFLLTLALAAWGVRDEPRRLLKGVAAAAALLVAVVTPAALAAGGWRFLWQVSVVHAGEHLSALGTQPWAFAGWGFVRGLAGPAPAVAFALLAAAGWWRFRRTLRWWFAGTLAGAMLAMLVLLADNRTYPRYWVLVWLLLATPAVAGCAWLMRARAAIALSAIAATVGAWWTLPAMTWVHSHELPVAALLRTVVGEGSGVLVFEDQLFSFRNLGAVTGDLTLPSLRLSDVQRSHAGLTGTPLWLLAEGLGAEVASPISRVIEARCDEPRVWQLSQDRFLEARLVRSPVMVVGGGYPPEWEGTRRFVWCRRHASLLAPPVAREGVMLMALEVHPQLAGVTLVARVDGVTALAAPLIGGRQIVAVPISRPADAKRVLRLDLETTGEARTAGDARPLALRLFGISLLAPPHVPAPYAFFPEPDSLFAAFAEAKGTHPAELLGSPARPAAWTGAHATLTLPVAAGMVGLELFAPRPQTAAVELRLGSARAALTVGSDLVRVALPVPRELALGGRATLEIASSTVVPGANDLRALGVAVSRVWFLPAGSALAPF